MRRKDIVLLSMLMMMAFYVTNRLAWLYGYCNGASTAQRLAALFIHMEKAFAPYFSKKYDITKHKRYRELADSNKKNTFDVEKYLKKRCRVNPSDVTDCYEYGRGL